MKKITSLFATLLILFSFASCASGGAEVDMPSLREVMLSADKDLPNMETIDNNTENAEKLFESLSDFDYSKIKSFFLSYADDGKAYEIAVVELKDKADVSEFEKTLSKHLENRITLYKNYDPSEVSKAEKAEIISKENVTALIMCSDQSAVKKAFKNGVK